MIIFISQFLCQSTGYHIAPKNINWKYRLLYSPKKTRTALPVKGYQV